MMTHIVRAPNIDLIVPPPDIGVDIAGHTTEGEGASTVDEAVYVAEFGERLGEGRGRVGDGGSGACDH